MKRFFYFLCLSALPFISCIDRGSNAAETSKLDSLTRVVVQKDSLINDVFAAMNGIAENLNSIKARENVLNTQIGAGEIHDQATVRISRDIDAIDRLLAANRETIARLQNSADELKKANIRIGGLEELIVQLNTQVENKDREIVVLKKALDNMSVQLTELEEEVTELNTQVSGLADEKSSLEGEVKNAANLLNTAYYIVGSEKELLTNEIIYKSGFIGRTVKINESRSLDTFTKVDVRDFSEVIIGHKKANLISVHPEGSYTFETDSDGVFRSLAIIDKDAFWEYSKVLVISYK